MKPVSFAFITILFLMSGCKTDNPKAASQRQLQPLAPIMPSIQNPKKPIPMLSELDLSMREIGVVTTVRPLDQFYAKRLVSGENHVCAVVENDLPLRGTTRQKIVCWGDNSKGQLGKKTAGVTSTPVEVSQITGGVTGIAAGGAHSCAVVYHHAYCWGDNSFGQLASAGKSSETTPIAVKLPGQVSQVATGRTHSCAIADGSVWCWGGNQLGQLGQKTANDCSTGGTPSPCSSSPVRVKGLKRNVKQISASANHTCALLDNQQIRCWGSHDGGQLGNGSPGGFRLTPTLVRGVSEPILSVVAGEGQTCAITQQGLECWGHLYRYGGTMVESSPVRIDDLPAPVTQAALTESHYCAVADEKAYCWGLNAYGELGDRSESTLSTTRPSLVKGVEHASNIVVGQKHSCAISRLSDGSGNGIQCWGANNLGQLGSGSKKQKSHSPEWVLLNQ